MERMGKEKQGQMIVYHLIDLLKQGYRLPTPESCPAEVSRPNKAASWVLGNRLADLFLSL